MIAALRLLVDVAAYRLRKREMANMAASVSVMLALQLPAAQLALRAAFAVALNLLVYLTNDMYDVGADVAAGRRDVRKSQFLLAHWVHARAAQLALLTGLIALSAFVQDGLVTTLVVAVTACWAYCAWLKRVPGADIAAIFVCGVAGSMLSFPLDRALGWCLALELGLVAACFQLVQVVRDARVDAAYGVRTTAVWLGPERAIWAQRVLLGCAGLLAVLAIHRWLGFGVVAALVLPARPDRADIHWNRLRALLGVAWLTWVGWIVWTGATDGLLVQIPQGARVDALAGLP